MKSSSIISSSTSAMRAALRLAEASVRRTNGGPFGAVIVRGGKIVGRGWNQVTSLNDPTAHAEVMAIRDACRRLRRFHLDDCELYTSCEPCPMCLAAVYWAHIPRLFYANTRRAAARIGFADDFIYREIPLPNAKRTLRMKRLLAKEAQSAFRAWQEKADKVEY